VPVAVQVVLERPAAGDHVTVPLGVDAVPASVSVTVAVQVEADPTSTGD